MSRRHLWVTAAVIALPLLPAAASARILHATSILPPGESGFVSLTGLASGTGSPYLYDQIQPYVNFARKDAMLGQPGSSTEHPAAGVTITRDGYGVPSVTGGTAAELWWGAGWATAEDRLFQLEIFRRVGNGTLSELVGPSELPMDIADRRDFYTSAEISSMMARMPPSFQQRYASYTAGINAYVDYIHSRPTLIPAEFAALGIAPTHFSVEDIASIGIYLARVTPNGDGSELTNMAAIKASGPAKFNKILPLRIKGEASTIPRSEGLFPSDPGDTRADERAALARSYRFVRGLPPPPSANMGVNYVSGTLPSQSSGVAGSQDARSAADTSPPAGSATQQARSEVQSMLRPIHVGGSYMVAVNNPRTHRAEFFDGPELGIYAPEELYEMELHGPGIDVRGVTAPGGPLIAIGHNAHLAFGVTAGLSETNSLYAERLVPGHPDEYHYRGRVLQMSCRNEAFSYRSEPTSLLNPINVVKSPPQIGSVTLRLCRTIHGPVQERVGNYAYARRYATWDRELDTLYGLAGVDTARNVAGVNRAIAKVSWDCNLMAADDHGNIGYWHPGLLPIRNRSWDERLPLPGDGRAEWRGFLSVAQRPHVIDPRRHWLDNWNTLPSQGFTTGNDPASEVIAGPFFRSAWLDRLAPALARHPSFAGMNALIVKAGTIAQQRPLDTSRLKAALKHARSSAAVVLRTILAWNGNYTGTDANNTVSPGVAAWQTFKDQLQAIALAPLGKAGQLIGGGEPNTEHIFDVNIGQAYALRTLGPAGYQTAAARTFALLTKRFGSGSPTSWREPRTDAPETSFGAEAPPKIPFFDRGTFEEVFELGP
jgi:penicillin G amidase